MKTLTILVLVAVSQLALAQEMKPNSRNQLDPLFPGKRKFNAGLLATYTPSTPPPVLIGDVTYGVSEKISVGVVGGTTGALALYGLRLNARLLQRNNFRGVFRMNAIYYPGRNGTFLFDKSIQHVMPWMFTLGVADAEWRTNGGTRWSIGTGYLETHCIDGMLHYFHLSKEVDEDDISPFKFYHVISGGVSTPVSKKLTIKLEVVVVMKGFKPIEKTPETKISPINPYLNFVYTFGRK